MIIEADIVLACPCVYDVCPGEKKHLSDIDITCIDNYVSVSAPVVVVVGFNAAHGAP